MLHEGLRYNSNTGHSHNQVDLPGALECTGFLEEAQRKTWPAGGDDPQRTRPQQESGEHQHTLKGSLHIWKHHLHHLHQLQWMFRVHNSIIYCSTCSGHTGFVITCTYSSAPRHSPVVGMMLTDKCTTLRQPPSTDSRWQLVISQRKPTFHRVQLPAPVSQV